MKIEIMKQETITDTLKGAGRAFVRGIASRIDKPATTPGTIYSVAEPSLALIASMSREASSKPYKAPNGVMSAAPKLSMISAVIGAAIFNL